jgi:serine/threonine-protein kinase
VLHAHLAADVAIVERFAREAAVLRELQGSRAAQAVTVYGSGITDDGAPYLAMELLAGETLHARMLASGRLPWREAIAIARGVCGALAEPHALGIVHRDVKPANVFLEAGGRVRVLDFGIAKHVELGHADADLTRQGELVGTLDYMAPEQLVGGGASAQADIFAIGVVLHEMVAGARPFAEAAGALGQLAALLGSEPAPLPDHVGAPAALAGILARCLHREPAQRYATVGQLDAALAALVEDDLGCADTFVAHVDDTLETDDTWVGALPVPPIAPPPVARVRFATGTSDDGVPYAPLPAPSTSRCTTASTRAKLTLGVAALLVGAAAAYLALAV